jgi:hypothetical protein
LNGIAPWALAILLADLGQCLLYQRQCPTVVSPPRFAPGLQTEKKWVVCQGAACAIDGHLQRSPDAS